MTISGNIHGCISSTFCQHALQFGHNTNHYDMGYITYDGWFNCFYLISLIVFKYRINVDIIINFLNFRCFLSTTHIFITSSLHFNPLACRRFICFPCFSWGFDRSTYWVSYTKKIYITCICQKNGKSFSCGAIQLGQIGS